MKIKTLCVALGLAGLVSGPVLAGDGPSARTMSFTCAGCHGTDGSSVGPASPHLASLDPIYFIDNMLAYRAGDRRSTIMTRIAKGYTEEQIEEMADWFAEQELETQPQDYDPAKAERGKKWHDEYCDKCHEDGGRDTESGILAGQWMPYLRYSFQDFLDEARYNPRKMERKLNALIEEQGEGAIDDLVHYYGSLSN